MVASWLSKLSRALSFKGKKLKEYSRPCLEPVAAVWYIHIVKHKLWVCRLDSCQLWFASAFCMDVAEDLGWNERDKVNGNVVCSECWEVAKNKL
jgi:hypothetical protein